MPHGSIILQSNSMENPVVGSWSVFPIYGSRVTLAMVEDYRASRKNTATEDEIGELIEAKTRPEGAPDDWGSACAICLEDNVVYPHGMKSCAHTFHRECLKQWLTKGAKECPLCRE